jgi:hypothetical protein
VGGQKVAHFLHGSSALVVTDHTCLRDLTTTKEFNNKRLMRYAVTLSEHNLKVVYREGKDHHLSDLMSRMSRLTPGSLDARKLCDETMGMTAESMQRTQCSLGTSENQRTDSDLFAPGSACRRIRHVMPDVERSEGKTIACLLNELEGEKTELDNHVSGDEHESRSRIMDFYDMVASVQSIDMSDIKESQQTDRFSTHMREYLLNSTLPSDEIETLAVMLSAPFYAVEQGILVRITKGKRLAPKPGEIGVIYGPPLK